MRRRLSFLYFLQFAVWGSYLSCFGQMLGVGGLGTDIQWFFAAVGIVTLITPALMGHLSDNYFPSLRLLGLCHLCASAFMMGAWFYCMSHPQYDFWILFFLYLGFLLFYMPTMALANTTTFALLKNNGQRPVDHFPSIRIWGTIGFVAAMWFVNSAYIYDGNFGFTLNELNPAAGSRFQYNPMQLLTSSLFGLLTAAYTLTLPLNSVPNHGKSSSFSEIFGLKSFILFRNVEIRTFLLFAVFIGVCLQISNGYAVPYINHFMAFEEYRGAIGSGNATLLFSLSQISEAAFVLITGLAMKRLGFKWVIVIAMSAWCLRFLFLGIGNPGNGIMWLVLSMIVYGISFNFFNIAGHIYMDQKSDKSHKGLGQGLLMMMSNGMGATGGMIAAGAVVNHYCQWEMMPSPSGNGMMRLFMGEWAWPWLIFALYALTLAGLFILLFRPYSRSQNKLLNPA